jgi:hypothetical protein
MTDETTTYSTKNTEKLVQRVRALDSAYMEADKLLDTLIGMSVDNPRYGVIFRRWTAAKERYDKLMNDPEWPTAPPEEETEQVQEDE